MIFLYCSSALASLYIRSLYSGLSISKPGYLRLCDSSPSTWPQSSYEASHSMLRTALQRRVLVLARADPSVNVQATCEEIEYLEKNVDEVKTENAHMCGQRKMKVADDSELCSKTYKLLSAQKKYSQP